MESVETLRGKQMDDDIVNRLRDTAHETDLCWEAAGEIERLRAEVEHYKTLYYKHAMEETRES